MLERLLSKWGLRVYLVVVIPLIGWFVWETNADVGIAHEVNLIRAKVLGGTYYPKLTFGLLAFPAIAIAFPFGLVVDYILGAGMFAVRARGDRDPPVMSDDARDFGHESRHP